MAYLVFKNEEGLTRSSQTLIRAAKTDADVQIIHGGKSDTVNTVEITDAEYDAYLKSDVTLTVTADSHSFENNPLPAESDVDESELLTKEYFEAELEDYKERLTTIFHKRPTHSQIGKITSAIDFLTNLDTSSISYPTENIDNKCRRADKYVNLHCI
tara:strand:+ start:257 stop:727 length:471 start_codon:yes stop_codon:yes gene_type:complete